MQCGRQHKKSLKNINNKGAKCNTCEKKHIIGIKCCIKCNIGQSITEFYKNRNSTLNTCKTCDNAERKEYGDTQHGFFVKLIQSSISSAQKRKNDAAKHSIVVEDLHELWENQNGLCYYSKIPMITKANHNWQCSLERKKQNLGYIRENIVLCCLEFQHKIQWTCGKFNELVTLLNTQHFLEPINFEYVRKNNTEYKTVSEIIDGVEYITCNKCNVSKPSICFNKNRSCGCKE